MKCFGCGGTGTITTQGTPYRCSVCGGFGEIADPLGRGGAARGGLSRGRLLFRLGLFIFGAGVVAGFLFVGMVGTNSTEFRAYFGYFIAAYMVGILLMMIGRRQ